MKAKNTLNALLLFAFALLFNTSYLTAQKLWGQAFTGGANNNGSLLQMNLNGSGFTKLYDFEYWKGSNPIGSVVQADNGKVYGICLNGGPLRSCVIYSINPVTSAYVMEWSFDGDGNIPASGLVKGANGLLYGVATMGGTDFAGVIYSWNTVTNVYTVLYDFSILPSNIRQPQDSVSGYSPVGSPMLASDGKLYGMASGYSLYDETMQGYGCIYSYDINQGTYTKLHSFAGVTDGFGFGSLAEYKGVLYGMTSGKAQYARSLMNMAFNRTDAPIEAINGGNIFSFNIATHTYTSLHTFDTINGLAPYGSLYLANDGKFYGVTSAGGAYNQGVIFSFEPDSGKYTKLYDFDGLFGATPMSGLVQTPDGVLFGSTSAGGSFSGGVIYRFNPNSNEYTVLYSYDSVATGASPLGGSFAIVNTESVGILAPVNEPSFSVYPVPAHNELIVTASAATGENPLITISDMNGRVIRGPQAEPLDANSQIKIDLSSYESGIYLLEAKTGDNVVVKKIVKD